MSAADSIQISIRMKGPQGSRKSCIADDLAEVLRDHGLKVSRCEGSSDFWFPGAESAALIEEIQS